MGGTTKGRGLLYIGSRAVAGDYEYKAIAPSPTHPCGAVVGYFAPLEPDGLSDFFTNAALLLDDQRVLRVTRGSRLGGDGLFAIELAG